MTQNPVDDWFDALPASQRPILDRLRAIIFATNSDAIEEFKWSRPCYSNGTGLFCYLHASKGHATIGFQKGSSLNDPNNLLEGEGKDMRHVKLRSLSDIDEAALKALLKHADSA